MSEQWLWSSRVRPVVYGSGSHSKNVVDRASFSGRLTCSLFRNSSIQLRLSLVLALMITLMCPGREAQAQVTAKQILQAYSPRQKDVDYEVPTPADLEKCQVTVERLGKVSGYVVLGAQGQLLRRFMDTNGDNKVDQWRYYNHGIEVYRDVDSNFNEKPDQFRYVNLGGSRWGIDQNEDGKVDSWKSISAAEVSREAIKAMTTGDSGLLETLLINPADLRTLGVNAALQKKMLENVSQPEAKVRQIFSKSKDFTPKSVWVRFDALMPGSIPADDGKAETDLQVYENAMCIVDNGGGKTALIQLGELVRVGDAWKLTQIPEPIGSDSITVAGGVLMQPLLASAESAAPSVSPEMQALLDKLQKLDASSASLAGTPEAMAKFNSARIELLLQIVNATTSEDDKEQWMQQLADGYAAAIQTGQGGDSLDRLKDMETKLKKDSAASPLVPYVTYRRMLAQYSVEMNTANEAKRADIQKAWLESLEGFISTYPNSEDASEAMLQLAITEEFNGRIKEAVAWYSKLAAAQPQSIAGKRAAGAVTRIQLNGQPLKLSGTLLEGGSFNVSQLKGKAVLVVYWATWCQPCAADLPQIRALYEQYRAQGFEIVGVCLDVDTSPQDVNKFRVENKMRWPQIYERGGLESPAAVQLGVITLPTMILTDRAGRVVNRGATVQDLKTTLPQILK
ncbi:Thiol-disulfide oxidoreductase ResA [Planctopirus ephydatiae]|uniref:Thiol-disulfide oxidoreductase ResA n=1 Tax=Planctopirus ephydatiae TaxID=2528019 RepID=A0A518GN16_9PLAN|nr:redoxin family protein [Planctopirus ephydatiae]QDV29956.1 Thiol-disulfide oxidoreductase ResA [Planctopirus ephydatiae]